VNCWMPQRRLSDEPDNVWKWKQPVKH
jgi:hypothetical protein